MANFPVLYYYFFVYYYPVCLCPKPGVMFAINVMKTEPNYYHMGFGLIFSFIRTFSVLQKASIEEKRKLLKAWWTESHKNRGKENDAVTWTSSLTKQKLLTKWKRRKESSPFFSTHTQTQTLTLALQKQNSLAKLCPQELTLFCTSLSSHCIFISGFTFYFLSASLHLILLPSDWVRLN